MRNQSNKIGFIAALSGRLSQLGVSSREALIIATELRNKKGGINGHNIELVIVNDESSPEKGRTEIKKLVDEEVAAIIGPLTSNQITAIKSIEDSGILICSPTISTALLSGKDDNFIRIIPATDEQGRIASNIMIHYDTRRIVIVLDSSNPQYTFEVQQAFKNEFEAAGGKILKVIEFDGKNDPDSVSLANRIISCNAEGVFLITSGNDAALIAQQLRKNRSTISLYGSRWTKTDELLKNGGKAVEGMRIVSEYVNNENVNTEFIEAFTAKTGIEPSFAAVYTFEIAEILFEGLRESEDQNFNDVKQKIVNRNYRGVFEEFNIDIYGDTYRTDAFSIIENGEFITYAVSK